MELIWFFRKKLDPKLDDDQCAAIAARAKIYSCPTSPVLDVDQPPGPPVEDTAPCACDSIYNLCKCKFLAFVEKVNSGTFVPPTD